MRNLILAFLILVLSACSTPATVIVEVTREVKVTVEVKSTVIVTATPIPSTSTPIPPTSTPIPPTSTPIPPTLTMTPTPAYQKWNNDQVIAAFQAAGVEMKDPRPMTKDDYGLSPMSAIMGTRFLTPSVCADCGGRIFTFATPKDLEISQTYYTNLSKVSAALFSWVFVKDNILVQINGDMKEEQARKYETVLKNLK